MRKYYLAKFTIMKSVIRILLVSIFLFVNFSVFGNDIISEKQKKEMILIGSKNLNGLIVQNRINDETNSSKENIYLFYTYNINEGDVKDPSKLLSDSEFKTLNDNLIEYNKKLDGKAKIYVALNGKIIYTLKNEVKLNQGSIKLSDLEKYSTKTIKKKVKEELGKVYGNILSTSGTSDILISSFGWFTTVSLANVLDYNLNFVERDFEEKILKNKIYLESYVQFNLHYKKGNYLTDVMFYNINNGVPTATRKNIGKFGGAASFNSASLASNLEKLNSYFFESLSDPTNSNFCEEGDKFFNAHSEINDEKIKDVIIQISSLICDPEADPKFFDEYSDNQYEKLFDWQKRFYDDGEGVNDFDAYNTFRIAYKRYLQYFKDAKGEISSSEDKDALLKISYTLTSTQLKKLTADEKLKMLRVMATGSMGGYWTSTSYNTEALALKIIESITNDEGESDQISKFITGLTADEYKIDKTPLYKELFEDIDDFFGSANFTRLILKFTELTLIKNGIDKNTINSESKDNTAYNSLKNKTKLDLVWDVQNDSFLWLFNVVRDNSKIKIASKSNSSLVNIKQFCKRTEYVGGYGYGGGANVCTAWETDKDLAPFDLLSLNIINDITFSSAGACGNTNTVICGKASLVPAVFMEYLDNKRDNTIVKNVVVNTLTVASFYFSGVEIMAAKGALTLATLPAYIDLFVTITNPYFSGPDFASHASSAIQTVFSTDKEKADELARVLQTTWVVGATAVTLATAKDFGTPKKHIETIAMYKALLKKTGSREKTLSIMAKEKKLGESAADGLEKAEESIRKSSVDAKKLDDEIVKAEKKIDDALGGASSSSAGTNSLANGLKAGGNNIDDITKTTSNSAKQLDEFEVLEGAIVKTNQTILDKTKVFWRNHETNVLKHLQNKFGSKNVGRQITVDVVITKSNGAKITKELRLDNLIDQGKNKPFRIVDAKSSVTKELNTFSPSKMATQTSTANQKVFYAALKENGSTITIKPRGQRAEDFFRDIGKLDKNGNLPNSIQFDKNIDFFVNSKVIDDTYNLHKIIY